MELKRHNLSIPLHFHTSICGPVVVGKQSYDWLINKHEHVVFFILRFYKFT